MLENVLQGLQKDVIRQLTQASDRIFHQLKRKTFGFVLQVVLFSAAAISLVAGFLILASRYLPVEYVLLLFGGALMIALLSGAAGK